MEKAKNDQIELLLLAGKHTLDAAIKRANFLAQYEIIWDIFRKANRFLKYNSFLLIKFHFILILIRKAALLIGGFKNYLLLITNNGPKKVLDTIKNALKYSGEKKNLNWCHIFPQFNHPQPPFVEVIIKVYFFGLVRLDPSTYNPPDSVFLYSA
jgi:hypothetical protein